MDLEKYIEAKETFAVRVGKHLRWPLNRFLARQSLIGTQAFFTEDQVPGLDRLRAQWPVIQAEAQALMAERESVPPLGRISPDHRTLAPDGRWKSFFFTGYGYRAEANRARCPQTAALVDQVPNLVVAFFSIFEPGTHVHRHRGLTKAMLNVHLGLIVPEDREACRMEVEGETRSWTPGEFLIFDETFHHEVWNDASQPRVVLFLQVMRPMRWRGRWLGQFFLWLVKRTSFVQDVRKALAAT
ncbi:MAG: aspartyl/asparaginyl beta-hydroxylase domain-containing protein [Novosphingobium sp.]|nr:MAG: aspartyl/asparaginyl beta-hydroxylase domain-containing protein [Novosphingobium sp.]